MWGGWREAERMLCEDLVGRGNWRVLGMMTDIESTERHVVKEVCRHRPPRALTNHDKKFRLYYLSCFSSSTCLTAKKLSNIRQTPLLETDNVGKT